MIKKKVIALTVDTALTNEQLERAGAISLTVYGEPGEEGTAPATLLEARNIRVLDADS